MTNTSNQKLKTALYLINKCGYKVFPCVPGEKRPLTGKGLYDASNDPHDAQTWWEMFPDANIGLPCGKENGICVLDIDSKSGGFKSLNEIESHLPDTYAVQTGSGGLHLYFKHHDGLKNRVGLLPGIDFRNDGGYVLSEGSVTTAEYLPVNDYQIQPLPQFLIDLIQKHQSTSTLEKIASEQSSSPAEQQEGLKIPEGGRNNYIASVAGLLRRKGISESAATNCCLTENLEKCNPPLPEHEVRQCVKSVFRYAIDPTSTIQSDVANTIADSNNKVAGWVSASDLTSELKAFLNDEDLIKGTPTGFESLDQLLGGGKRVGEITCWHAHAKTGKNAFWHKLMHFWLKSGVPVAYASRELTPAREVLPNLLSIEHQENAWTKKDSEKYEKSLQKWPLYFARGYGYFPWEEIEVWLHEMIAKGVKHFWFDHLHYMLLDPEEHKEASILIKKLKTFVMTHNVHIDIIVQPNKLLEGQKLGLATIKGGAAIGQAIDNLIVLERDKEQKDVMKVTLDVARSRLASPGTIHFQYYKETTDFIEVIKAEPIETMHVRPAATVTEKYGKGWWDKSGMRHERN